MIIQQDTRQKKQHHLNKEKWFEEHGIKVINSKLLVGDYMIPNDGSVSVDTKKDMSELYGNLIQSHARFRAECDLAREIGVQLYVLVENEDGITCIDDITKWQNPLFFVYRKKQRQGLKCKPPVNNIQLKKVLHSMERDHGVKFLFCSGKDSAETIVRLLNHEIPDNKVCEMA